MHSRTWLLVLNGKSAGDEAVREAVTQWRERGVDLRVRVTWEAGDAELYVQEAVAQAVPVIVAAGGDGTLSEVAEAMAHMELPAAVLPSLGLLPLGTANDFASANGIPTAPVDALALIDSTAPRAMDLLRVDGDGQVHWCANLASGGFGTEVTVETPAGLKKMLGGLAYVVTGISRLGKIEPIRARLVGEGFAWEGGFIALGIGNGRQAGGGQLLCPEALLDDGLLDITVIPEMSGELMGTLGTLFSEGKQAAIEEVVVRGQVRALELHAESAMTLNLDGEPLQARHFRIECMPGRVRMHLPANSALLAG